MQLDRDAVMPTFLAEAEENLAALEQALLRLDGARAQDEADGALAEVFRVAHTLKGNAESLGLDAIGRCAHALENVLDAVRRRAVAVTPALVTVLLGGHDALRSMTSTVAAGGAPDLARHVDAMDGLNDAACGKAGAERADSDGPAMEVRDSEGHPRQSLRVDLATLDRILTHTGELSIALARLHGTIDLQGGSLDALAEVERLFADLREQAMRLRLVPIGPMLRQQLRAVRDLAASHGKLARLVIDGDDVEVDAAVRDGLRDPITHMVRNAVDHALEAPEARRAAGKEPVGTVTLRARYEAGWVVVEVCDDGAGFRRGRILERARALGLVSEATHLGDDDLLRLVLAPGFSTAAAVTDLSGRGVGMDVVARNVTSLKGSISIRSTDGLGAVVTLRVPLTLAIIDGFAVGAAGETYVIPMEAVRECVALDGASATPPGGPRGDGVVSLRGEPLPFVRLSSVLGLPDSAPRGKSFVVVEHDGMRAGLVVDALLGETQAVVKPLGGMLQRVDRVAGSTILGNGRVALILDVVAILREAVNGVSP
jgi:two-component system chemotaxis sensor kinase CheA